MVQQWFCLYLWLYRFIINNNNMRLGKHIYFISDYYTDNHLYVFSVTLGLPLIRNNLILFNSYGRTAEWLTFRTSEKCFLFPLCEKSFFLKKTKEGNRSYRVYILSILPLNLNHRRLHRPGKRNRA